MKSCSYRTKLSVQVRGFLCEHLVTVAIPFNGEQLSAPRPNPNLEDHPLSVVRDCLFNTFAATLHTGGGFSIRNPRTRHLLTRTILHPAQLTPNTAFNADPIHEHRNLTNKTRKLPALAYLHNPWPTDAPTACHYERAITTKKDRKFRHYFRLGTLPKHDPVKKEQRLQCDLPGVRRARSCG
jgi:hypothetical protein